MKGREEFAQKLKRLAGPEVVRAAGRVLYVGSDRIRAEAHRSITAGAVSGKGHVPSAPGEPPNEDTGVLRGNITNQLVKPLVAQVTSVAPYASALEFGTSKMEARPYMRPARDAKKREIEVLFAQEMSKLVRRS